MIIVAGTITVVTTITTVVCCCIEAILLPISVVIGLFLGFWGFIILIIVTIMGIIKFFF